MQSALSKECALCQTVGVANAELALPVLEQRHHEIALVVADERLTMTGLTGTELLSYVGERYPDMRRVLLTGYATGHMVAYAGYRVLSKDFAWPVILDTICRILRQP